MLILNKNILTIGGNRLEGGPLTPPEPPGPSFDEVTIGNQTWMAKNLSIEDGGEGIEVKDNVTANNVNFGTQYYYTLDAAVRVAASISGWHLPTNEEWGTLVTTLGGWDSAGTKLKSTTGWNNNKNGTDEYGFTVFPVGSNSSGSLSALGSTSYFWTASEYEGTGLYSARYLNTSESISYSAFDKTYCFSVRLIKDT